MIFYLVNRSKLLTLEFLGNFNKELVKVQIGEHEALFHRQGLSRTPQAAWKKYVKRLERTLKENNKKIRKAQKIGNRLNKIIMKAKENHQPYDP